MSKNISFVDLDLIFKALELFPDSDREIEDHCIVLDPVICEKLGLEYIVLHPNQRGRLVIYHIPGQLIDM